MQSKAASVKAYLAELPADRREMIAAVRQVILENIDQGFEEGMQYGMIGYYVPHSRYPAGYHCDPKQPLPFACLASQKNYCSLYLMTLYIGDTDISRAFLDAWKKTGKKLDMGKSCLRFKRLDDLALDVIGDALRKISVQDHIDYYETMRNAPRERPAVKKKTVKKAARKSTKIKKTGR